MSLINAQVRWTCRDSIGWKLQRERNGRERGGEGKEARELGKDRTEKGKPNETIKHVTPNVSSCTGSKRFIESKQI